MLSYLPSPIYKNVSQRGESKCELIIFSYRWNKRRKKHSVRTEGITSKNQCALVTFTRLMTKQRLLEPKFRRVAKNRNDRASSKEKCRQPRNKKKRATFVRAVPETETSLILLWIFSRHVPVVSQQFWVYSVMPDLLVLLFFITFLPLWKYFR